jgi:hypothetical protein
VDNAALERFPGLLAMNDNIGGLGKPDDNNFNSQTFRVLLLLWKL